MYEQKRMTPVEQDLVLKLYKAHYTAKEIAPLLNYSYATIQNMFRGFILSGVTKYNRISLIPSGDIDDNQRSKLLS